MPYFQEMDQLEPTVVDSQPYVVVWRLTEFCDLDCAFCDFRKSARFRRRRMKREEVCRLARLIGEWSLSGSRRLLLSWLGGEPLTWAGLFEVSRHLRSDSIATGVTTNGRLLTTDRVDAQSVIGAFDEITVSIDGWRQAHERSRGIAGLYTRVMNRCCEMTLIANDNGAFKLRANVLLDKKSLPHFPKIVADCVAAGFSEVSFNALWVDNDHKFADRRLSRGDLDQLRVTLKQLRREFGAGCRILGSGRYVARLQRYAQCIPVPVRDCGPGRNTLFVDSSGLIAPCAYTGRDYGIPSESLRTSRDIDELMGTFRQRRLERLAPACFDCPDTNVFGKFDPE